MIHFANKNPYTGFKFWVPKWQTFSFIDNLVTEPTSFKPSINFNLKSHKHYYSVEKKKW